MEMSTDFAQHAASKDVWRQWERDPLGLTGTIFDRRYRVDGFVAEGGFGFVYAAVHLALAARVALKVLRPALRMGRDDWADLVHQFREEAIVLNLLRRSHVVGVLDSGIVHLDADSADIPWMALEWLDGETLQHHLARRRERHAEIPRRSPAECFALLRPVFEAIADAHDMGIAHRDLKPSNIMLVPTARGVTTRVLDFGSSKRMAPGMRYNASGSLAPRDETLTDSRARAFSPTSAAPEQLAAAPTGPWTDVYALAAVTTQVLTDRPPTRSNDPTERYRRAFSPIRPTPASAGVDVGPWEPILARALSVRPANRQKSARDLLGELECAVPAVCDETREVRSEASSFG
jgi:serine/threonine-protein kinase